MSQAKTDLSKRGQKAIFKMKTMFKNGSVSIETLMHLFDHIAKPILLYASDVWGSTLMKNGHLNLNTLCHDEIENCHLKFCRYALGVSRKAPTIGIYGETGRYPLAIEAIVNTVKYWHRIKNLKKSTLVYKAYSEMENAENEDSWCNTMQLILRRANVNHQQLALIVVKRIKSMLEEQYLKYWHNKLCDD